MDAKTIKIYDAKAALFAKEWEEKQDPPDDLQAAIKTYFRKGRTIDIGCGSGRDTAWLLGQGFEATGVDASCGLIAEATRRHPRVSFEVNALPKLNGLLDETYVNVLCETVIMHLSKADAMASITRLVKLLTNGGTLYLSWRVQKNKDERDNFGRLYTALQSDLVRNLLGDYDILLDECLVSASSGNLLHRVVARRR